MSAPRRDDDLDRRRRLLVLGASFALASCGGGGSGGGGGDGSSPSPAPQPAAPVPPAPPAAPTPAPPASAPAAAKSAKRGIAYDLAQPADFAALAPGISWWYDWAATPDAAVPAGWQSTYGMGYVPMLWNDRYDAAAVQAWLAAHADVTHLLVMNEPNLVDQANLTPAQAAAAWPGYEAIAAAVDVQLVGPAMTWGTMPGYADPVAWLDAFYTAYRTANGGRDPRVDALAFHWYDYGLGGQLDRLAKYGKPFWVTEFANWHAGDGSAQVDTAAKQEAQMADMVATCESRADVQRYAWFTGRWANDVHFTSLLGADAGQLTALGAAYLAQPFGGG